MLQPASRQDVVECYRAVLGREPENRRVADGHLIGRPLVRDVIAKLAHSSELRARHLRANIAFERAREPDYLARSFGEVHRVQAYFGHYGWMVEALSDEALLALITDLATVYLRVTRGVEHRVVLTAMQERHEEGELQLQFYREEVLLYVMGVTIVPGWLVNHPDRHVLLISRMQGVPGTFLEIRQATKDLREIDPKAVLFAALQGVAVALGLTSIVGVVGINQLAYMESRAADFRRHYDEFFTAAGGERGSDRFFTLALGRERRPSGASSRSHAKRAEQRRRLKDEITASAADEARQWLRRSAPEAGGH